MLVEYESEGNSIVYFGREDELLAIIAVKDRLKATTPLSGLWGSTGTAPPGRRSGR